MTLIRNYGVLNFGLTYVIFLSLQKRLHCGIFKMKTELHSDVSCNLGFTCLKHLEIHFFLKIHSLQFLLFLAMLNYVYFQKWYKL